MTLQELGKTYTDPLAVLPAVEWVLLLRSILQKRPEIPNAWIALETVLKANADAKPAWADKSAVSLYQSARKKQTKKLSPESGLYMLRFVKQKVLRMSNAKKWQKMPIWKVALDRLITEGSILNKRDRLTAGAMAGAFLGAYFGVGTISPFYRRRLANQEDYFSRGQSWFNTLAKPLTEVGAEDPKPKDGRSSNYFKPYFAHKDQDELKTVFYTVAVRNGALRAKYPGGVAAYHQKQSPTANRNICISCFVGGDVDTCVNDLLLCGLMPPDDFICFDATAGTMCVDWEEIDSKPRDLGISWLKARYHEGYLWVRYNGRKRNGRAVQI